MKYRIYTIIAAALVTGAIFYSGTAILGQSFGSNPIKAGAVAAKPNGVPTCLVGCPERPIREEPDNDIDDHPAATNSSQIQQQAVAIANGNHSVAIAKNTAIVHQRTVVHHTTVGPHPLPARRCSTAAPAVR